MSINLKEVSDIEFEDVDTRDFPDFCDAFISSATYKGRKMTEKELDKLNDDSDFLYIQLIDYLY
jgi:hypothetical protein|tara:strand:- start:498 stop:689 length:192 start_codon:yes stop_codon:yes gene_type:complete